VWTDRGWPMEDRLAGAPVVKSIDANSPNFGKLQKGDLILAVNGERRFVRTHFYVVMRRIADDAPVQLLVERSGVEHLVNISLAPFPYSSSSRWRYFIFGFLRVVACLSVALLIALLGRVDRFSRLTVASYLAFAVVIRRTEWLILRCRTTGREELIEVIVLLLTAGVPLIPLSYHSILIFPPDAQVPASRFWVWLRNLLYAITFILFF